MGRIMDTIGELWTYEYDDETNSYTFTNDITGNMLLAKSLIDFKAANVFEITN